ncbi:MAG: hypothetical protein KDC45_10130 [Bacteroidetes bacterium]|nr:hypothetical protein [Bacteroidota bacterium]
MLTQKSIERLSKMGSKTHYVTSLYLNVDPSRNHGGYKIELKDLLKDRRQALDSMKSAQTITRDQALSLEKDFARIEDFVQHEYVNSTHSKGLVIFACSATQFWEMIELPQPVTSHLNADYDPYVRTLSELLCEHRHYAVVLVDSAKAKILDVNLGVVKEHMSLSDEVSSKVKYGGIDGSQERNINRAHEEMVQKHLRRVSGETQSLFEQNEIMWLILGGRQKILTQFEGQLPQTLRKRVIGHIVVEPDASLPEILIKADQVAQQAESKYEQDLINRLRGESHAAGGRGIFGLQPTLQSLRRGGVNTLVVAKGFKAPGFVCHKCFFIGTPEEKGNQDTCPICAGKAHPVDDVIEEAITFAFMQGCRVENTAENSRLKIMGNVGALLRF